MTNNIELLGLWLAVLAVLFIAVASPLPRPWRAATFVAIILTIWLLWALFGAELIANLSPEPVVANTPATPKLARLGQAGDLFGGVNALFAALAFAGVAFAAVMQARTTDLAHVQAFESTLFEALTLHHTIVDGLKFDPNVLDPSPVDETLFLATDEIPTWPPSNGREVFAGVLKALKHRTSGPADTVAAYRMVQDEHNYVLGHYFRHLYQVLKLIDRHPSEVLSDDAKARYASMVRAQLSADELVMLLLNCLEGMVDGGAFRNLVVKYRMLEHVPLRLEDGVYLGGSQNVPVADESIIRQYLAEQPVKPKLGEERGAFGTNPIALPR